VVKQLSGLLKGTTMIATNTTQFLITRTTRLRAWARRVDPYTTGSLLVLALIVAGGLIRNGLQPAAPPAPIIVYATPVLPSGEHGTVRRQKRAPAALRTLPTAIVPTEAPEPQVQPVQAEQQIQVQSAPEQPTAGYIAHTDQGDVFVPDDATPVPAGATYDGPFLAPVATEQPADAPRLCTGFGDWRDFDPAYAASPICHKEAP